MIASTVISSGRTRLTAPCSMTPTSSASVGRRPQRAYEELAARARPWGGGGGAHSLCMGYRDVGLDGRAAAGHRAVAVRGVAVAGPDACGAGGPRATAGRARPPDARARAAASCRAVGRRRGRVLPAAGVGVD